MDTKTYKQNTGLRKSQFIKNSADESLKIATERPDGRPL